MARRVRVGVVGLGQWGRHHARIYAGLPDVELVGVVDLNRAELRGFVNRYRTAGYTDYRELIGKVDAVSVAAPTALHHEITRAFLRAGIHCLVEKPITTTVAEAEELVELADRRDLVLLVGHVERFKPAVRRLIELSRDPLFIQARRVRPYDRNRVMDVGVVMDLMVHDIDIVLSLAGGRVTDVGGMGVQIHNSHEDLAVAHLSFSSGCVAWLLASRVSADKVAEIEVTTADRAIRLDYHKQQIALHPFGGETEQMAIKGDEPLRAELRHFVNCVQGLELPLVRGEDGLRALEVALRLGEVMAVVSRRVHV
ncbi:MAG: Gfo/Idh/MocA family oxidoreductase [Armatimonadota bacterium]|nr:Gfo/Idh/MocA family oxidoreductase [Armatimonadota bacterium]MDR7450306.1 Gfo/Idh/MocA family oxidoreductase [Armatimonadota bacterium]MDR7467111.1 Gfo/Idh/MocA family oxidoreductase [Armatimonadota bacterium]MDR7493347.1 Gfo/Idh/MocA family oxidoreductase [Armatimonadota bacterium]MDR7499355.1 Gfo/Idh/MocA family oxidoreductase [Armatimonadota bacterium]